MKRKFTLQPGENCQRVMLPHGEHNELGCVGEIYENTFVTKRDPNKHIMRRWNAYGINKEVIDSGLFETIVFQEETRNWMISVDDFKMLARVEHIEGEEPQYFIDRDKLVLL